MGIQYTNAKIHWNYFLAIERDFEIVTRFIEPCEENNDVFSVELARIIMAATQEVDVVMKALCKLMVSGNTYDGINQYLPTIAQHEPGFLQEEVRTPRFGMSSKPWGDWSSNAAPLWWTANNKIKHTRGEHFNKATLKNGYNSLAALLLTTAYYYRAEKLKDDGSATWWDVTDDLHLGAKLFQLNENYYRPTTISWTATEW